MSVSFAITGGARVVWINATWPLAILSVGPERLTIAISVLGTYTFAPDEVSAIERYVMIPVLGSGIRIHHCKPDCPQRVIFWSSRNPEEIIQRIRDTGFAPSASMSVAALRRGIAMRWSAIIIAIVIWNLLFLVDGSLKPRDPSHPGPVALTPLIFAFALSVGTMRSRLLQHFILKPGRSVGEIKPFLRLLALISGILLVTFSVPLAFGAF